jgi:hypothetical protein
LDNDKLLFIRGNSNNDFIFEGIKRAGYHISIPYRGNKILFRGIREIWFSLNIPWKSIWYNKKILYGQYEIIIIYSPLIIPDYIGWIKNHFKNSRIVLLYTNIIERSKNIKPDNVPDCLCEKWSWDPCDCIKYGLNRSGDSGYFLHWKVQKQKPLFDIMYIGRDKGRVSYLRELEKIFKNLCLSSYIYIVADRSYMRFFKPYYQRILRYDEIRAKIAQTRAILDIVPESQLGTTMRVMESIFNEIKLITNNKVIANYDFYHKDNIFILGVDNIERLPDFIASPYHYIEQEILKPYEFESCLKTILKGGK